MKTFFASIVVGFAVIASAANFDIRDEAEFKKVVSADAKVEKLAGDMGFVEGPVWNPADVGHLIFSDIPNNELKKWTKDAGLTTFRKPSQNANGNTLDLQGRLTTAEHSGRRVSVTEKDGTVRSVVAMARQAILSSSSRIARPNAAPSVGSVPAPSSSRSTRLWRSAVFRMPAIRDM